MIINDKLVLVTGASSGIGAATAKAMAKAGGRVVLLARRKDILNKVATRDYLKRWPSHGHIRLTWLMRMRWRLLRNRLRMSWGYRTSLSTMRAQGNGFSLMKQRLRRPSQMMAVPYFAAFNVTHAFLPAMLKRNSGHFDVCQLRGITFCLARSYCLPGGTLGSARLFRSLAGGP